MFDLKEGLKFMVQGDLGSGNVMLKPREGEKPEEKVGGIPAISMKFLGSTIWVEAAKPLLLDYRGWCYPM